MYYIPTYFISQWTYHVHLKRIRIMQLLCVVFSRYQLGQVADCTVQIIYFVKIFNICRKGVLSSSTMIMERLSLTHSIFASLSLKICYEWKHFHVCYLLDELAALSQWNVSGETPSWSLLLIQALSLFRRVVWIVPLPHPIVLNPFVNLYLSCTLQTAHTWVLIYFYLFWQFLPFYVIIDLLDLELLFYWFDRFPGFIVVVVALIVLSYPSFGLFVF